jgi:hypothetical protein
MYEKRGINHFLRVVKKKVIFYVIYQAREYTQLFTPSYMSFSDLVGYIIHRHIWWKDNNNN